MKEEKNMDTNKTVSDGAKLNTNSNTYTIIYAMVMVVIVALLLAFTSQSLRSIQKANEENDKRQQILRAVKVTVPAKQAESKICCSCGWSDEIYHGYARSRSLGTDLGLSFSR